MRRASVVVGIVSSRHTEELAGERAPTAEALSEIRGAHPTYRKPARPSGDLVLVDVVDRADAGVVES
jgi:hypothetical protein